MRACPVVYLIDLDKLEADLETMRGLRIQVENLQRELVAREFRGTLFVQLFAGGEGKKTGVSLKYHYVPAFDFQTLLQGWLFDIDDEASTRLAAPSTGLSWLLPMRPTGGPRR